MFRSPTRMILTTIGLTLAIILLMTGMIFTETYLNNQLSVIEPYKKTNVIVVSGDVDYDVYDGIRAGGDYLTSLELKSNTFQNVKKIECSDRSISVNIRGVRVNACKNYSFLSSGETINQRYSANLLYGRFINDDDIDAKSNVTVITAPLSELLFGSVNSLGEVISFPIYKGNEVSQTFEIDHYESYTVIGVISESDYMAKQYEEIITQDFQNNSYTFDFYIPLSVSVGGQKNEDYQMCVICTSDIENYKSIKTSITSSLMTRGKFEKYEIVNYDDLYLLLYNDFKSTQQTLLYIVLFMFILSGFSIANTMFFAVKERINEIGIRKAIGAFNEDIVFQFLFEGFIYGMIGSLLGIFISVLLSANMYLLLKDNLPIASYLNISSEAILLSFSSSTLIGILASIFPAGYAAKIKVADSLRFE